MFAIPQSKFSAEYNNLYEDCFYQMSYHGIYTCAGSRVNLILDKLESNVNNTKM